MKENGFTIIKKRQEADDTPHKLLLTQTAQMVLLANTPTLAESFVA